MRIFHAVPDRGAYWPAHGSQGPRRSR